MQAVQSERHPARWVYPVSRQSPNERQSSSLKTRNTFAGNAVHACALN